MLDIGIFGDKVNITKKLSKDYIIWLLNEIFFSQEILLPSLFPVGKGWLGRSGKLSFQNQARNPFDPVQHLRPLALALSQDMVSTNVQPINISEKWW